jgi:hypothetical protein
MFRDMPVLKGKVADAKSKSGDATMFHRQVTSLRYRCWNCGSNQTRVRGSRSPVLPSGGLLQFVGGWPRSELICLSLQMVQSDCWYSAIHSITLSAFQHFSNRLA